MPIQLSEKTIKRDFIEKVKELSGQNIYKCFQCGTCGGSCPMAGELETLPRKIMRMAQFGLEEELADSKTFWVCASCHNCTATCPRGIDLARVMEALRLLTLRKNVNYIEPSEMSADSVKESPQIALVSCFRKLTS